MERIEDWHQPEQKAFAGADLAWLSQSTQNYFQPIDRSISGQQDLPWALDFGTGADLYRLPAYTGERRSLSALMTDDVEQKLDAPKIQPPSETARREGQFTEMDKQATWTDATESNRTTQKDSATMEALSDARIAEIKAAGGFQKFELFDSKAEEAPDVVAWDPREQLKQWGDGINKTAKQAKQVGAEVSAELTKDGSVLDKPSHPYKDNPDQLMDYNACQKAWKHFAVFARHENLDAALLPAIIRNEVRSLRADDKYLWNPSAEHGLGLERNRTIGPANMATWNIDRLIQKYPQLTDPELGGIDPKHVYRDALNPAKAAWLSAAYLADAAERLEQSGHKVVSHHDLIKSYNPNANQEEQFKRIHEQIIQVKQHHPLFRDE